MQIYIMSSTIKVFISGVLLGIVLSSIGFTGLWRALDKGIDKVKTESYELAR